MEPGDPKGERRMRERINKRKYTLCLDRTEAPETVLSG